MPKFENAPNLNNPELNHSKMGADVNAAEKLEGELTPEELEQLKAEEGQEQEPEKPELSPEERLKNLEDETESRRQEMTRLTKSIEGIKSKLNEAREKLGLPPTEEEPPSTFSEKDKLKKLKAEQGALEKQKEELVSQQEKERLIREEKEKIPQEKLDELFKEFEGPSDKRKYADRAKYLIRAVAKRRKKIREMAIEYKGGKCMLCGYDQCLQTLEFHHVSNTGKDFGVSDKGHTRSWEKVKKEIDKCVLVCANCHRELHIGIKQLPKEILE